MQTHAQARKGVSIMEVYTKTNTITCQPICYKKLFHQMYMVDVKLIEGSISQSVSIAKRMKYDQVIIEIPIQLMELSKTEGTYRMFFRASEYTEMEFYSLLDNLMYQQLTLDISKHSNFEIHSRTKKIICVIDDCTLHDNIALLMSFTNIPTDVYIKISQHQEEMMKYVKTQLTGNIHFLSSFDYEEMQSIFDDSLINTQLYISGSGSLITYIKELAYSFGLTDDNIQCKGIGHKREQVFCVKCYHLNLKKNEVICEHCKTKLSVSNHFSKRLGAYLGYVNVVL